MSWMLSTSSLLRPTTPEWLEDVCQRLLENNSAYQTLELIHPRMDDRDAKTLAKALHENATVTTLVLSCYSMVDDGTAAVASTISDNTTIVKLQLRDLRDVREIATFFRYLARNQTITDLSLRHCTICPRGATIMAHYMKDNAVLEEVRITDSQFIGNAFPILCQEGLYRHPSIQRLYFVNDDLNETTAEHLANLFDQNGTMEELYIGENNLGDDGIASIVKKIIQNNTITALRHLDLRSNNITSIGAMSLQGLIIHNATLRSLIVSDNEIGDYGLMALSRGLQHPRQSLCKLDVHTNRITSGSASTLATMLRSNQSLQELNLSFNSLGDEGVATIVSAFTTATTTNHHSHYIRNNKAKHHYNTTLRTLSLRRNGITNVGAQHIAAVLPYMNGLKELLLSKNDIDGLGVAAILHGLRSNVDVEYLDVDYQMTRQASSSNRFHGSHTTTATSSSSSSSSLLPVLQREMVRCMKLNKAGRRIFRSTIQRSLWPFLFGRISTDTDMLFHFLVTQPDIIQSLSHKAPDQSLVYVDPTVNDTAELNSDSIMDDDRATMTNTTIGLTIAAATTNVNREIASSMNQHTVVPFLPFSAIFRTSTIEHTVAQKENGDDDNITRTVLPTALPISSCSVVPFQISSPKRKKLKQIDSDSFSTGATIRTCATF